MQAPPQRLDRVPYPKPTPSRRRSVSTSGRMRSGGFGPPEAAVLVRLIRRGVLAMSALFYRRKPKVQVCHFGMQFARHFASMIGRWARGGPGGVYRR